ncbi:pectate lyase [Flavilitoribacter nigricans]|uniref:Pectate lyase n=1 Tax=Flavilitoribacter nigricans (strain ATCC 23147 / DSM 23189 / NBRC 102662 / NCIMB 1420 / SS-2) TaxID=1122177 RepID=A0A2D0MZE3_FLAN2|nr:pectate lyase [Flavilitoribacter nigricans]PHN01644.1 pectate lyase [Flavilitoribacter nigricans DSM 23189 = NBRC 102662]
MRLLIICCLLLNFSLYSQEPTLAFPGAEGYGRFTNGGRGGQVLFVDNLSDSGPGSLRAAVESKGARIVLFRVSGTIRLEKPLKIKNDSITIAGQSAPGDGICLRDQTFVIDADEVIIRFMRFRLGDASDTEGDAMNGRMHRNIIVDHCSFSWSTDECLSLYTNEQISLQWNIIAESLNHSVHEKGAHGYGGIWGGVKASFHHNLIAHHNSRNPRLSGLTVRGDIPNRQLDFYNNVIYNWRSNSIYGNEAGEANIVNNYFKPGPATPKSKNDRIMDPSLHPMGKIYVAGNYVYGHPGVSADNWNGGIHTDHPDSAFHATPFALDPDQLAPAVEAYTSVLLYAGASLHRDAVDTRVVEEVHRGIAHFKGSKTAYPGIIDSQQDVGGWPELQSYPYPNDTDGDGLPDRWETNNGYDPTSAAGASRAVEAYLNELVEHVAGH